MPSNQAVRLAMSKLADTLRSPTDLDETLSALTASARDTIPGVDYASITLVHADGTVETKAPTDPLVVQCDEIQAELREGPCYDAATEDGVFVAENLAEDPRWPAYGPKAAALGIGAQMGLDLHAEKQGERAALNLYAHGTWLFVDAYETAEMFASHASLVLGFARSVDHLGQALATRKTIGQALGIVMERYTIDEDRAFEFLVRVSKDSNVKLRLIAQDIVDGVNRRNANPSAEPPPDEG
jgi:hypothetical protein